MLKNIPKQYNMYSILYDRIPKDHILKKIAENVDFSFINKELEKTYCKYYGRPAKEPELMVKILLLQHLYNLSDERVIEDASLNLAYMYFLGINPDEDLPHPSLLAKFRTQKLDGVLLDHFITEIIKQCVEKGIIKSDSISIDATHTEANTKKKVPERIMKHLMKRIKANYELENEGEKLETEIPDYKQIENHKEAKAVMKNSLETLINEVENKCDISQKQKTSEVVDEAKEVLESPNFIEQKGIRSLVDKDARVGRKSRTQNFFGYKTEYTMTTKERMITAVHVGNGVYVDGTETKEMLQRTTNAGIKIKEVYGDKAYFRKHILDFIKEHGATAYIPVSESVYKIDETKFTYNKDSDQWFCSKGNCTEKCKLCKKKKHGKEYLTLNYYFDIKQCKDCEKHDECAGKIARKILRIGINTPEFYEISQWQKTEEFKEKYKSRACHEGKNGEMKKHHGLAQAKGYGSRSMEIQAKLTALAVNLKRIASIATPLNRLFINKIIKLLGIWGLKGKYGNIST